MTSNSRRAIDLDHTTGEMLSGWRTWQAAERTAAGIEPAGWVFAVIDGNPIHPRPSCRHSSGSSPAAVSPRSASTMSANPRNSSHHGRRTRQGGQRAAWARQPDVHHLHLPTRPPRYASRCRPHLREPDNQQPEEKPVEGSRKVPSTSAFSISSASFFLLISPSDDPSVRRSVRRSRLESTFGSLLSGTEAVAPLT
jgi:hypothetical protein